MLKRIITAIIGLVIFLGAIFAGNIAFNSVICVLIFASLYEVHKSSKSNILLWIASGVTALMFLLGMSFGIGVNVLISLSIIIYMTCVVALHGKVGYNNVLASLGMTLYITISYSCLAFIRGKFSIGGILFPFIITWATDSFAYFGGRAFGKRKLAPVISPNKTIEGSICGTVGGVVLSIVYVLVFNLVSGKTLAMTPLLAGIIALVCSLLSQIGDLVASAIKRDMGVKDFGNILPGHGGFMDRFDSVLYIAPIVYNLLLYIK